MKKRNPYKFIYNPGAGAKRKKVAGKPFTLGDIKSMLKKYQIPVDPYPSKSFDHLLELSKQSVTEGYRAVLSAGGDGTVAQVANGLIKSDVTLGIIPMGTFMNIARMLSIPMDLEQAIMLIKIGRERRIDVGSVSKLNGDKLTTPSYFLESAGIGLDAKMHEGMLDFEKHTLRGIYELIREYIRFYQSPITITVDDKEVTSSATMVSIANGPYSGPAFKIAPKAKLNDHRLTVVFYQMNKWELVNHVLTTVLKRKTKFSKIKTYQAEKVTIGAGSRLIHADARVYGKPPAEFRIIPNALTVITGFPEDNDDIALEARTELDP